MTMFNVFLLLLIGIAFVLGCISGITKQLGSLAAIILGIIACRVYGTSATAWAAATFGGEASDFKVIALSYAGLFIIVYFAAWIAALALKRLVKAMSLGFFDSLAGGVFKAFLWVFAFSLALNAWIAVLPENAPKGAWADRVVAFAPTIIGMGNEIIEDYQTCVHEKSLILRTDSARQNTCAEKIVVI